MTSKLNRRLKSLIKVFFPNCGKLEKVTVSFTDELVAGSANPKAKEVFINKSYRGGKLSCGTCLDAEHLDQLLLHELCHITGSIYHGPVWQGEYERCLYIAKDMDRDGLSILIEEDLRSYQDKRHYQ